MARKESQILTEAELRLMEVVWELGEATVQDVVRAVEKRAPLAYTTVLTMMRILEEKGYLEHEKDGRAFVYRPRVKRDEARGSALRDLLRRFFDNSAEQLVHNLLRQEKLSTKEIARLKRMIEEAK